MSMISILRVHIAILYSVGHAMLCFARYVEKIFHPSRPEAIMVLENVLVPMKIGSTNGYNRAILMCQHSLPI